MHNGVSIDSLLNAKTSGTLETPYRLVDLDDDFGRTPLHAACREWRATAVRTLLKLGAIPNCETSPPSLNRCHYVTLFRHA
jgi:ankyrin repeat protein